jgi:hypothetical protein
VHWPIIVFYLESKPRKNLFVYETFALGLIILIVAALTYRYFEHPMRVSGNRSKTFLILVVTMSILVVSISVTALALNKKPFSKDQNLIFTQSTIEAGKQMRFSTRVKICEIKGWENCDNPESSKFSALILGDSHAIDALNAMYSVFPEIDYSMSQLGGCPPTNRMRELVPQTFPDLEECLKLNKTRYNIDYLKKFDVIVVNVLFGWYPPEEMLSYLTFLKEKNVEKVIVFGAYYETHSDVPLLINQFGFDESKMLANMMTKTDSDLVLQKPVNELGYVYISKSEAFCENSICALWKSNTPFTWDSHHLSFEFATGLLSSYKTKVKTYLIGNRAISLG